MLRLELQLAAWIIALAGLAIAGASAFLANNRTAPVESATTLGTESALPSVLSIDPVALPQIAEVTTPLFSLSPAQSGPSRTITPRDKVMLKGIILTDGILKAVIGRGNKDSYEVLEAGSSALGLTVLSVERDYVTIDDGSGVETIRLRGPGEL